MIIQIVQEIKNLKQKILSQIRYIGPENIN